MDFLDKLYSSNYFGIGLFAVISFLVVMFLIVLFFGKKDEKRRKLEETQNIKAENTFKETTEPKAVEIPNNPEPVAPIKLDANIDIEPTKQVATPNMNSVVTPIEPVMPIPPVAPIQNVDENNEYLDNLIIDEPIKEETKVEPITPVLTSATPIINEQPKQMTSPTELEPTKFEIPKEPLQEVITEPVKPIINENITPIIKEDEPQLQINEEPVINTYYKPMEKENKIESIKVPTIDYDSLANSISKELDELEQNTHKYDEVKVTPLHDIVQPQKINTPNVYDDAYVKTPVRELPKVEIELPKKIDLPARKSE